jgi:hypothetical protein
MKQLITFSFFMLSFLAFNAQNTSQSLCNKYLGTWISNDENKKFILNIDKDSIRIENGAKSYTVLPIITKPIGFGLNTLIRKLLI